MIASGNGLSPTWRGGAKPLSDPMQLLSTGPLGINFNEICLKIQFCIEKKIYI